MKKQIFSLILTAIISLSSLAQTPFREPASTVLTDWMDLHCRMVRRAKGITHVAYSRHFSYTAIAAYESSIAGHPGYRSLAGQLNGLLALPLAPKGKIYNELCVNAAYAEMLRAFYSSFEGCNAIIDSMEKTQKQRFLQGVADVKSTNKSSLYGKTVATHILKWANADGSNTTKEYTALKGEGLWTPSSTAASPFWAENRNMAMNLFSIYSLNAPVYSTDTSASFYKMVYEVYNTSRSLSDEQKSIALFWDDSPNGKYMTVFGHWTSIVSNLIKQHRLSLIKATEAYAKMTIALHDASILAWKGKFQYNVLRPISFIQQQIDKTWNPLIATPPHPEFPAAHATLSNAAAVTLGTLFGDSCSITDNSYTDIGMKERTYNSLQDAAREAGLSRLYGGIHYRYSIEQGFILGEKTARFIDQSITFHITK
jgi:hypothetical protein